MLKDKLLKGKVLVINFALIVSILLIFFGISTFFLNTIKKSNEESIRQSVTDLAESFEEEFFRLNNLLTLCKNDSDFILFLSSVDDVRRMEYLIPAQEKMKMIESSMSYIENICMYRKEDQKVLTTKRGFMPADQFWKSGMPSEEWLFRPRILTSLNGKLYCISPIRNYGSLLIEIDQRVFSDILRIHAVVLDTEVAIYDNQDRTVLKTSKFPRSAEMQKMISARKIKDEDANISYYTSFREIPAIGYSCIQLSPMETLEIGLRSFRVICGLSILMIVLIAAFLFLYNRKTYLPVQRMLEQFGSKGKQKDDIEYITRRLTQFAQQNSADSAKERMDISLYYLFYNQLDGEDSLYEEMNRKYSGSYLLLLACQDEFGETDSKPALLISQKIPEAVLVPCEMCLNVLIIPDFAAQDQVIDFMKSILENSSGMKAFAAFSKTISPEYSVKTAFHETLENLQCTSIHMDETLTVSSEENRQIQQNYLKLEVQQQIINCIINSDFLMVQDILNHLLHGSSSLMEYRNICSTVMSLLTYTAKSLSIDSESFKQHPSSQEFLSMCNPVYMNHILITQFAVLDALRQNSVHYDLCQSITEYLQKHYMESLSLDSVSSYFHISPAYLSTFFKREIGENFSVYLANLRILKAKQLLKETEMKVSEVSERVGIPSQTTFIRLFKKYAGMTPVEYRKSEQSTEDNP